ncbi:hypothetical protein CKK33_06430 [Mucilaginibacter sp. MD40]|uniref:hypothetical protein n=1 Tax=Mucilaginibacter sp. MD40 TaxID=2029590 RepID=UPI000BAC89B4|nr:hypothetical protein [Mucilaginibacter sp. MD40]PAW93148.1 hypothetical protein CKK33_06430 [Mucilaginibacter sp. MD40]
MKKIKVYILYILTATSIISCTQDRSKSLIAYKNQDLSNKIDHLLKEGKSEVAMKLINDSLKKEPSGYLLFQKGTIFLYDMRLSEAKASFEKAYEAGFDTNNSKKMISFCDTLISDGKRYK